MKWPQIRGVVSGIASLPTLPVIATQALQMAASESASAKQLGQLIENDPALAAKLLRAVNNVDRGLAEKVSTVDQAIVMLGLKTVRSTVLSVKIFEYFQKQKILQDEFSYQLWIHSITAGCFAAEIARRKDRKSVV